jgi:hypothetical protein
MGNTHQTNTQRFEHSWWTLSVASQHKTDKGLKYNLIMFFVWFMFLNCCLINELQVVIESTNTHCANYSDQRHLSWKLVALRFQLMGWASSLMLECKPQFNSWAFMLLVLTKFNSCLVTGLSLTHCVCVCVCVCVFVFVWVWPCFFFIHNGKKIQDREHHMKVHEKLLRSFTCNVRLWLFLL